MNPGQAYDVIIIGGSYAGLAAALPLARARRRVLVIDAGRRRNRHAEHSYGLLGHDGSAGATIAAKARGQLLSYATVQWLDGRVSEARREAAGFVVHAEGHADTLRARRLLLAYGVIDDLPDVPGLRERWGRQVFHCPYCHGYELRQGAVGVLARSPLALHHALMLPDWGPTTLFLNDSFVPDAQQAAQLAARGVRVEAGKVAAIEGEAQPTIVLSDGRRVDLAGVFTQSIIEPAGSIAQQLGCEIESGPMGRHIQTDAMKATSVPWVFACGDVARPAGSVPLAVGDGTLAGTAVHASLIREAAGLPS